jgi:hypothetical protein
MAGAARRSERLQKVPQVVWEFSVFRVQNNRWCYDSSRRLLRAGIMAIARTEATAVDVLPVSDAMNE